MIFNQILALSTVIAKVYFKETFDQGMNRWSESKGEYGSWSVTPGTFYADPTSSKGLKTMDDYRFYALSAPFDTVFDHKKKDFVVQFSVKFEQNIDCGGGYVKIMPPGFTPEKFTGDTVYNIMFGPDVCGMDKRVHAILNYKGENHLIKKSIKPKTDQLTRLYTFWIKPDQTYEVWVDLEEQESGKLVDDWDLLPPEMIPDPDAKKPSDWVDDEMMDDPTDKKPADWKDVPATIPDPEAKKPEEWDDEDDGEWERPTIPNPAYKGPWIPKQIKNPLYKGPWEHPKIKNKDYKYDANIYAYKSAYIGFDLWQVKAGTIFDNIIVTDSIEEAKQFAKDTFEKDREAEKAAKDELDKKEEEKLKEEQEKVKESEGSKGSDDKEEKSGDSDGDDSHFEL